MAALWLKKSDWINMDHEHFHPTIYECTECEKPVAYGDYYCSNCGVKFYTGSTQKMKNKMFRNNVIFLVILAVAILKYLTYSN
jgi:hypothetical protein